MSEKQLSSSDLDCLARSWIPRDLAEFAGLFRVTHEQAAEYGFTRNGHGDLAGVVFPYPDPVDGRIRGYRLRRDNPELEHRDGALKPRQKYLCPPGQANLLFFPPAFPATWLEDTSVAFVITEGEKKALAVHHLGTHDLSVPGEGPRFAAIGISGAWSWRGRRGKETNANGKRVDVYGPIADLDRIVWTGRKVTLWPDANVRTNRSVQAAWKKLAEELKRRGAIVRFAYCPNHPEINGPDDGIQILGPAWGLNEFRMAWASQETQSPGEDSKIPGAWTDTQPDSCRGTKVPEIPRFPESAWVGTFAEYRDIVEETCESPAAYHHAAYATLVRCLLAKFVKVGYVGEQPLSEFIVLMGRSGFARKDTARRCAQKLMRDVAESPDQVGFLPGIGSGEGLIDKLADPEALAHYKQKKRRHSVVRNLGCSPRQP